MWCLADSRVKTSAARGVALGLPAPGQDSGERWQESSGRYDHDSRSWKTRQCSLLGGLESCSETWPRWGMMRGGEWWERTTPEHLTGGSGSGLWLTPTAMDATPVTGGDLYQTATGSVRARYGDTSSNRGLAAQVTWPTPTARDWKDGTEATAATVPENGLLGRAIHLRHDPKPVTGGMLNPTWVEWLMGWPLGWTDCAASATDRYLRWCDSHGVL